MDGVLGGESEFVKEKEIEKVMGWRRIWRHVRSLVAEFTTENVTEAGGGGENVSEVT